MRARRPGAASPLAKRSALHEVIGGEHVVRGHHRRHRDAAALRLGRELELALVLEEGREHRIEDVVLDLHAAKQEVEMISLQRGWLAEPRAHRPPLALVEDDEPHETVGAGINRVDRC